VRVALTALWMAVMSEFLKVVLLDACKVVSLVER